MSFKETEIKNSVVFYYYLGGGVYNLLREELQVTRPKMTEGLF